jgi:ankyrin repeat protein
MQVENVLVLDTDGESVLHQCAHNNAVGVAKELLEVEESADFVNTPNHAGLTALHVACKNGYRSLALLLLKHRAYINAQTLSGDTPLHMAASHHHYGVVDLLLE